MVCHVFCNTNVRTLSDEQSTTYNLNDISSPGANLCFVQSGYKGCKHLLFTNRLFSVKCIIYIIWLHFLLLTCIMLGLQYRLQYCVTYLYPYLYQGGQDFVQVAFLSQVIAYYAVLVIIVFDLWL